MLFISGILKSGYAVCSTTHNILFSATNDEFARYHQGGLFRYRSAVGADKAHRPSKPRDKGKAGILAAKPFIKLLECSRIINTGDGVPLLFHGPILHLAAG